MGTTPIDSASVSFTRPDQAHPETIPTGKFEHAGFSTHSHRSPDLMVGGNGIEYVVALITHGMIPDAETMMQTIVSDLHTHGYARLQITHKNTIEIMQVVAIRQKDRDIEILVGVNPEGVITELIP